MQSTARLDLNQWNQLKLFEILCPDPDDKAKQRKTYAGQDQKREHRDGVLDVDAHKKERGDQDDDPDKQNELFPEVKKKFVDPYPQEYMFIDDE